MACSRPDLASQGVCATVISINDHTTTSTRRPMVPRNLRVRIVMSGNVRPVVFARLARGKGRTIRGAEIHSSAASMTAPPVQKSQARAVRWWLISIAALIAIMVLVGGATRLRSEEHTSELQSRQYIVCRLQ